MFGIKQYFKAESISHAVELLTNNPGAVVLSGGTDVIIKLREGHGGLDKLIDIHDLQEMKQIELKPNGTIEIGAGLAVGRIMEHPVVKECIPAIIQGVGSIGGPQVRNSATMGGNVCNGAPSGDSACPLLIYDAKIRLQGPNGERVLKVADFYQGPGRVDLQEGELATHFIFEKEGYEGGGAHFVKYAMRNSMDIATIGCGAFVKLEGNIVRELRLAYTVAAPTPTRVPTVEKIAIDKPVGPELLRELADTVLEDLKPRNSWRASKDFREHIIKTLASRVSAEAIKRAGGELA